MRQIVLDTETTGLEVNEGHRIIEIGGVELLDRRLTGNDFHHYLQPDREIDAGAGEVHGITHAFLQGQPRFADIQAALLAYLRGAELIIHNAPFDVGFLDAELGLSGEAARVADLCTVYDTLDLARRVHPGQKNSLDALCRRYAVDNSRREQHGALLDARILADVYLAMTGGQVSLLPTAGQSMGDAQARAIQRLPVDRPALPVIRADADEQQAHQQRLQAIDGASGGHCLWLQYTGAC